MCSNSGEVGYCLTASAQQSLDAETETLLAVGFGGDVARTLSARHDSSPCADRGMDIVAMPAVAIQERAISENPDAGPDGVGVRQDGASYTLEARQVPQAVAFAQNTRDEVRLIGGDGAVVGALAAEPGMKQQAYIAEAVAWSIMPQNSGKDYRARRVDVAQPLMAGGPVGGNQGGDYIQAAWQVRRLTPVECERLQAFPDGFTRIPYRNKPADACPDGPRYKALGNSWAVNCAEWIGERMAEVEGWK